MNTIPLLQHPSLRSMWLTRMVLLFFLCLTVTKANDATPMRNGQVKLSTRWSYLGPFPVGKNELDLDPTESFGGILSLYRTYQETKRTSVPKGLVSELLLNGGRNPTAMDWVTIQGTVNPPNGNANKYETVSLSINNLPVPWNSLIQQLSDMTVLEHQGWLITTITIDKKKDDNNAGSKGNENDGSVEVLRVRLACIGITHFYLYAKSNDPFYMNHTLPSLQWLPGDQYHTGTIASYYDLPEGEHLLLVKVRAKVQTNFACSASSVKPFPSSSSSSSSSKKLSSSSGLELGNTVITPDIVHGILWGDVLSLPVTNTRNQWLRDVRCHVEFSESVTKRLSDTYRNNADESLPTLTNAKHDDQPIPRNNRIAPGGMLYLPCRIHLSRPLSSSFCSSFSSNSNNPTLPLTIRVSACTNTSSSTQCNRIYSSILHHSLRCRNLDQSTLMTFIDHDGSVQHAGVIVPLSFGSISNYTPSLQSTLRSIDPSTIHLMEKYNRFYGLPILLSMHGTGVSAGSQADSYKVMVKTVSKDYVFGVENMWILTPSRHGAHNWQGIGQFHALQSVQALHKLVDNGRRMGERIDNSVECGHFRSSLACLPKVDKERILFAGHSMGGAGAWHASTSSSDFAIATAPAAGWLVKEGYSDANIFQRLDASEPLTSPHLNSVLLQSVRDQRSDAHASNLQGIPAHVRVGQDDNTVPAYFSRRMVRYLEMYDAGSTVEKGGDGKKGIGKQYPLLEELPQKEHWWWDTVKENDGGVLNDEKMRQFYLMNQYRLSSAAVMRLLRGEGNRGGEGEGENFRTAWRSGKVLHTLPSVFSYRSSNQFVYQSGRGGIRILQSSKANQAAEFTVEMKEGSKRIWMIETKNVRRLRLDIAPVAVAVEKDEIKVGKDEGDAVCKGYRIDKGEAKGRAVVPFLPSSVCLDNQWIELPTNKRVHVCREGGKERMVWTICYEEDRKCKDNDDDDSTVTKDEYMFLKDERGPYNAGPMRLTFAAPYVIVVGTQDRTMEKEFLTSAIYLSQMFTMAYHSYVPVVKDIDLVLPEGETCDGGSGRTMVTVEVNAENGEITDANNGNTTNTSSSSSYPYVALPCGSNLLLLGDTQQNTWSKWVSTRSTSRNVDWWKNLTHAPAGTGSLRLVPWTDPRTYTSSPVSLRHPNLWNVEEYPTLASRLALILSGNDIAGYKSLLRLSEPTIPPMVRSPFTNLFPDTVVVEYTKLVKEGYAGIREAGMYDSEWNRARDSFYVDGEEE